MIPAFILQIWLLSLLSLLLVGGAGYVIHRWYEQSWQWNATAGESFFAPTIGANEPTYYLIAGILIGTLVLAGRPLLKWILKLLSPSTEGIDPRINPVPRESRVITGVDGAELYVEFFGSAKAPPIVCTHGWGLNRHAWNTLIAELKSDFNVIVWDLPGLGKSSRPSNRDYALEKLAANLKCVLS